MKIGALPPRGDAERERTGRHAPAGRHRTCR